MTEDGMVEWYHRLNGRESEQTLGGGRGQGSLACCSPQGHKESDTTERLNNKFSIPLCKFQKRVIARSYGKSIISYIRNCQTVSQSGCAVFVSLPIMIEHSCCSTSSLAFSVVNVLNFGHSNKYVSGYFLSSCENIK